MQVISWPDIKRTCRDAEETCVQHRQSHTLTQYWSHPRTTEYHFPCTLSTLCLLLTRFLRAHPPIMKFPAVGILLLQSLAIGSSTPGGTVLAERVHSRDIVKRVRDCGVFTMACDLAGNACNNACYHIYCQPGGGASRTMVSVYPDQKKPPYRELTLVDVDMTRPTVTHGTVCNLVANHPIQGAYATVRHSVKHSTIRRTLRQET